ncbi:LOW QUALITY PROTEIN: uncharacterized protein EMH_0016440 [Eimeria mitis]|uniref:Uncharacterized protein n=1 Tax=Eimeria mitis TaxID=44415 RepID=U6KBD4_9EIME|nr:LOW QUALITY PROTEIN: uncharacterized protein EMH_0016440 [Eimeria mitis]CDJ33532.1 hypothetical protein EMH_0016440 [Eimeria mitis]
MCKTLFNRDQRSGVTRRQLAEGGDGIDEDERSIVEGCLDLQEEIGVLHQSAVSSPEGDSSSRVTALVSMLSEAAAATESTQVPRADERLYLSEQLLEGGSGLETKGDGIVRLQTPLMQAYVQRRRSAVVTPALDPDSWIETIPSKTAEPEREARDESSSVIDDESMAGQASASHMSMMSLPRLLMTSRWLGKRQHHICRCKGIQKASERSSVLGALEVIHMSGCQC